MGSACDMADIERFLRSPEGREVLNDIRLSLERRRVVAVSFSNDTLCVGIDLLLDDGSTVSVTQPDLDVEVLRVNFQEVLEREYYVDFPERRSD